MKDLYDILEVPSDASPAEIRSQYRFLLNVWHPDKHSNPDHKAKAAERTKIIIEAFGVLSDPIQRARYDRDRMAMAAIARPESHRRKREAVDYLEHRRVYEAAIRRRLAEAAERRRAENERRRRERTEAAEREQAEAERQGREAALSAIEQPIYWITVPAGEFLYGELKDKLALPDFRIARYPVTNAQYAEFLRATRYNAPRHWPGGELPAPLASHPVVHVSWHDAMAYCEWARVRLPTEEEWEKAARGVDGRRFPWGNVDPTSDLCNFHNANGTTRVGLYGPRADSPYGCADMAGNVWEWTASRFDPHSYVLRGGSWRDFAGYARSTARFGHGPGRQSDDFGFRPALSL